MNVRPIEIEESITLADNNAVGVLVPGDVDNITIVAEWAIDPGNITIAVTNQVAALVGAANTWFTLIFSDAGAVAGSAINLDLPNKGRFAQYKISHSAAQSVVYRILKYRTPSA